MTPTPARSYPPLIKTKLCAPQMRARLVPRPRLRSLLAEGSARSLMLISAPPGYGKTTLITEWISSQQKVRPAEAQTFSWVSLDEEDNDPTTFLRYLVTALENQHSQISGEARDMLEAFPPPPFKTILSSLINSLHDLAGTITLVLDDYQFITNRTIQEGMAYFLDHLPGTVHVIIATRSDPPLPLARLRVRNQLTEIRADELRFSPEEAFEYLSQVMRLPVSAGDISVLETRTEGWIAGLQMAALAMQGLVALQGLAAPQGLSGQDSPDMTRFIQAFSGSHRYILDYLVEEVLNRQPESVRRFLFATSILERFCAPLCDEVTGEPAPASPEMLDYLERSNLFLIVLDELPEAAGQAGSTGAWYRYHHLFAELLRARLQQSQPGIVSDLHLRASQWFDQNGFPIEAIQHSLAAADSERAAELIERYGSDRWASGDPSILLLISRLPAEMPVTRPILGIYLAWTQIAQGEARLALPLLGRLKAHLSREDTNPDGPWMQAVIDLLSAYATEPSGCKQKIELPGYALIQRIPEQHPGLRSTADFLYAILLNRQGEIERSAEILRQSIQQAQAGNIVQMNPMRVILLTRSLMMLGQLHQAAALCQQTLETSQGNGENRFYSTGSLNILLGEALYEWNELERAEQCIRLGIRANAPWQNVLIDSVGYADLATVQSARGDLPGALETIRQLESILQGRTEIPDVEEELSSVRVRLWLANGEMDRVSAWADQAAAMEPIDYLQGWRHLTLARVRAAQERYVEAQQILEGLSGQPGAGQRVFRQLRIDLLLAIVLFKQNKPQQAFKTLEACLAKAQPGGYCRLFLDCGAPARNLLLAYTHSPAPGYQAYVQKLIEAFPGEPLQRKTGQQAAELSSALLDRLTQRELEVLRLMAAGSSNRQIAETLILSEGTVKFYVHSILEKIGVHSRTLAIVKAKELRLI